MSVISDISAIEWSHFQSKNTWSECTRKPVCQIQWEADVFKALEPVAEDDPYQTLSLGEMSAVESVNHKQGSFGMDTRPKVFDSATQSWVLIDSGSCVSCVPKSATDKEDQSYTLKSVNGGVIKTYGSKEVTLQMGRKMYKIQAVIADIPQKIFGWDLFRKYALGFEWSEWGDLFITGKKANIKALTQHVRVPANSIQRMSEYSSASHTQSGSSAAASSTPSNYEEPRIEAISPDVVYFQTQCMKELDNIAVPENSDCPENRGDANITKPLNFPASLSALSITDNQQDPVCGDNLPVGTNADPDELENLKVLKTLEPKYANLVKKHPNILKHTFREEVASHGVFHEIKTGDETPSKAKMRPLIASSEKSKEGRKIWMQCTNLI